MNVLFWRRIVLFVQNYLTQDLDSADLVATFPTKRTPIVNIQFTPRNICLVAGTYQAPESR